ncbi:ZIP zinc transporter-domain-containing protein [Dichotomopilus funicola]|uniref:ZIP zinc transporter-domain-containing protein n=1 Tax=Dichotomopilus funicola TaxID=1934379 RepID=A0AAN6ZPU0_9PEZI|nr:ZIP zinc transporter-domain-containing protein [Dichotomopilus funicola]
MPRTSAGRIRAAAFLLLGTLAFTVWARSTTTTTTTEKSELPLIENLSLAELDSQLQQCPIIVSLSQTKAAHHAAAPSSLTSRLFAILFPSSHPAINALLATLYISGPPNFLLALCPTNIDPASLSIMVAFAVGGLLGDTLFHLLPEIFLGEDEPDRVRMVLVEPNRNLLLGVAILGGFLVFVAMDKGLRIATGGGGHDHGHGHGHGNEHGTQSDETAEGKSSAVEGEEKAAKLRKGKKAEEVTVAVEEKKEVNPSVKLGGLLNMIADFTHNITDGLAMSASFYASPTIGATTTVAVFFHEIPHEVGDFALLVQSGFSKRQAMGAQFVTAVGALLGTLIGIAVQEFGGGSNTNNATNGDGVGAGGSEMGIRDGLWGTSLSWGDMLLPFTAGTFLYVGTVAVIPELLETGPNKAAELRKTLVQFAAIFAGAGIMLYISWHD